MSFGDEDCLHQLQILNTEILKLIAHNPELRRKQLQVRAAHLVAETLDRLMTLAELTADDLAAKAVVPNNILYDAVAASFEASVTWETVAILAEAAGFRFEIQYMPESHAGSSQSKESEVHSAGGPHAILIRFPSPFNARLAEQALQGGLRALVDSQRNRKRRIAKLPVISRKLPVWELVRLADDCCFELEFRFALMRTAEEMLNPEVEIYYQFGASPGSQCHEQPEGGGAVFEPGYRN